MLATGPRRLVQPQHFCHTRPELGIEALYSGGATPGLFPLDVGPNRLGAFTVSGGTASAFSRGRGKQYNGTSDGDFLAIPAYGAYPYTMGCVFRADALSGGSTRMVLALGDGVNNGGAGGIYSFLYLSGGNAISFQSRTTVSGGSTTITGPAFVAGDVISVAVTKFSSTEARMYVNGREYLDDDVASGGFNATFGYFTLGCLKRNGDAISLFAPVTIALAWWSKRSVLSELREISLYPFSIFSAADEWLVDVAAAAPDDLMGQACL